LRAAAFVAGNHHAPVAVANAAPILNQISASQMTRRHPYRTTENGGLEPNHYYRVLRPKKTLKTDCAMPRFFFHIRSSAVEIPDEDGQEFGCASDAHDHAQQIIRRSLIYLNREDRKERWNIRICNEENERELVVLFPVRSAFQQWTCPD
jgi:hypothetical protein